MATFVFLNGPPESGKDFIGKYNSDAYVECHTIMFKQKLIELTC